MKRIRPTRGVAVKTRAQMKVELIRNGVVCCFEKTSPSRSLIVLRLIEA